MKADLGKKGIYYRVRLTGYDDKSEASGVCSKLKKNGVSCFVSKS
jgi:cell division protein FtsN